MGTVLLRPKIPPYRVIAGADHHNGARPEDKIGRNVIFTAKAATGKGV